MAGFFRRVSETESETESSDGEQQVQPVVTQKRVAPSFLPSDSEEETKRVVKATKDKRYDEIKEHIKLLRNSKKIKDMLKILTEFEELCKSYEKARAVIAKEGGTVPRFYVRYLSELDDFVGDIWEDRETRKNLSKNNAKGLSSLRQKLRKYKVDFESEISAYRENPDPEGYSSHESEDEAVVDESDGELDMQGLKRSDLAAAASMRMEPGSESSESEGDWSSETESSESEPELEDLESKGMEELRRYFLKRPEKEKDDKEKRRKTTRKGHREHRRKRRGSVGDVDDGEWEVVDKGGRTVERAKLFEKDQEINYDVVLNKLSELLETRGRKSTNRREQVEMFKELLGVSEANNLGPAMSIKILLALIAGLFDYSPKMNECMAYSVWKEALTNIIQIVTVLDANHDIFCSDSVIEEEENLTDPYYPYRIRGCILSMVERLDDEFTKVLQNADCHSTDYVEKLSGETDLCDLILQMQSYYETKEGEKPTPEEVCRLYMRRIEHVYYKFSPSEAETEKAGTNGPLLDRLCQYIYKNDMTRRLRSRAVLCHVYHHALHDNWQTARDLLQMSHLQVSIDHADVSTQLLFNRAICQVGLCAFRHGRIREAHNALSDIQNSSKARELLAQGLSIRRDQEKTAEQEKLEKQRQVPYHMHINLELLECVYLITAMLLEIPQMASKEFEVRRRLISRSFHYQLKQSERQSLLGPPENTREHVVSAARALLDGDWHSCKNYIFNDKMNAKVWNLFTRKEQVKEMLLRRIQEESLRTYMLTYSSVYDSVSLARLADMFEMAKKDTHAIISKMIINEELSASLDEPTECVVMHRVEPTRLQTLALQLTEKINSLADNNEQIMDPRPGQGYAFRQQGWQQQRMAPGRHNIQGDNRMKGHGHGHGHGRQQFGGGRQQKIY